MSVEVVTKSYFDYVLNELAVLKVNSTETSSKGSNGFFCEEEFPALGTESAVYLPTAAKGCKSPDLVPLTESIKSENESIEDLPHQAKGNSPAEDQFFVVLSKTEIKKRKKEELIERKKNEERQYREMVNNVMEKREMINREIIKRENEEDKVILEVITSALPLPQRKSGRLRKRPEVREKEKDVKMLREDLESLSGSLQYRDQLRTDLRVSLEDLRNLRVSKRMGGWDIVNPMGGLRAGSPKPSLPDPNLSRGARILLKSQGMKVDQKNSAPPAKKIKRLDSRSESAGQLKLSDLMKCQNDKLKADSESVPELVLTDAEGHKVLPGLKDELEEDLDKMECMTSKEILDEAIPHLHNVVTDVMPQLVRQAVPEVVLNTQTLSDPVPQVQPDPVPLVVQPYPVPQAQPEPVPQAMSEPVPQASSEAAPQALSGTVLQALSEVAPLTLPEAAPLTLPDAAPQTLSDPEPQGAPEPSTLITNTIPEGIDLKYLALLPKDLQNEVIEEFKNQGINQLPSVQKQQVGDTGKVMEEVNPEFLASLPLNIQLEVQTRHSHDSKAQAELVPQEQPEPIHPSEPILHTLNEPVPQAVLVEHSEPEHEEHKLGFVNGCVSHVLYVGPDGCRRWDYRDLKTTFWILDMKTIIMLRSNCDVKVVDVFNFLVSYLKLLNQRMSLDEIENPILSFKGKEWDPKKLEQRSLFNFSEGSTFLLFDKEIPDEYITHKGFLWQCRKCEIFKKAKKHLGKCKDFKGREYQHDILFKELLSNRTQWGSSIDKHAKPYGCPTGHDGVGPRYIPQVKDTKPTNQREDDIREVPNVSTPRTPTTPRSPFSDSVQLRERYVPGTERIKAKIALNFSPRTKNKSPRKPSDLLASSPQTPSRSRRKSKKIINYVETKADSEPEDLSSDEDSVDEYNPESEGDHESDFEVDHDSLIPSKGKVKKGLPYPLTDEESDEEELVKSVRRTCRASVRAAMRNRQAGEASAFEYPHIWVPTEKEQEMINMFIAKPAMKQGGKYAASKFDAPHWVREMVERGEVPTGATKAAWGYIARSAVDYIRGFKEFVGQWQKQMQESTVQCEKLIDGHLPLTRVIKYFSREQIQFPEKIANLLAGIKSPDVRKHAFNGVELFLKSIIDWLSETEAIDLFEKNGASRGDRIREKEFFQSVVNQMKNRKPYQEFHGDAAWHKKQKERYQTDHAGRKQLDALDIKKFLDSQCTIDLISELIYWVHTDDIPTDSQFIKIVDGVLQRIHLTSGMRKEIWTIFTYDLYCELRNSKDASRPFISTDPTSIDVNLAEKQGRVMMSEWGTNVYVREDLHTPDPIVRNDPLDNEKLGETDRDLLLGKYTIVKNHKTGTKYQAIVWFSKFQLGMCDMFEEIRFKFMVSKGKNPVNGDTAFFMNSKCEPFITPKSRGFDWTDFILTTGCGTFVSHQARHIMSDYVMQQDSQLIKEGRKYLMCNSDDTDRRYYQLQLRHTELAISLRAEYESSMNLNQNLITSKGDDGLIFLNQAQKDRQTTALKAKKRQEKEDYLSLEREVFGRTAQTEKRLLTQLERTALIQCIIASTNSTLPITKYGDLRDLFLSGKGARGQKHVKIMLRLLFILPSNLECVRTLHNCLILLAELKREETSLRKIECDFAQRLLRVFNNLSQTHTLENQNLMQCFVEINRNLRDDQEGFFCGNALIFERVGKLISQEKVLESLTSAHGPVASDVMLKQFHKDMLNRFKIAKVSYTITSEIDEEEDGAGSSESATSNYKDHVGKYEWTDEVKVLLLKAYILHAANPLARPQAQFGKAEYIHNLRQMRDTDVCLLLPGDEVPTRLLSLSRSADTLAQFFYPKGKGLKKQGKEGGLAQIIDNWMKDQEVQTVDHLRENVDKVIDSCYPI